MQTVAGSFAPVQTCPGAHPASCAVGTGSFPAIKRPGRCTDLPPHLAPRYKKEQSYTSTAPPAFVACSSANFPFTFICYILRFLCKYFVDFACVYLVRRLVSQPYITQAYCKPYCFTVHFVESLSLSTNKCTYIYFN